MTTLIYDSIWTSTFTPDELELFLTTIRLENSRLNVTGILLYHNGNFIQIIEGENLIIADLFEKIKNDERHNQVIKLVDFKMKDRSYENWSMAFKVISKKDWTTIKEYLSIKYNLLGLKRKSNKSTYLKLLIDLFIDENTNKLVL